MKEHVKIMYTQIMKIKPFDTPDPEDGLSSSFFLVFVPSPEDGLSSSFFLVFAPSSFFFGITSFVFFSPIPIAVPPLSSLFASFFFPSSD